jgi:hypothetical protein
MTVKNTITSWDAVPVCCDLYLAARIVGKTPERLAQLARQNKFPAVKREGVWRIAKSALMEYCGEKADR